MLIHSRSAATVRISRDQQERPDPVGERPDGLDRGDGVPAREQVLRLQLLAGARGEAHPEVRQPVVPRAGPAELRRGGCRVEPEDRVQVDGRGPGAEQVVAGALRPVGRVFTQTWSTVSPQRVKTLTL